MYSGSSIKLKEKLTVDRPRQVSGPTRKRAHHDKEHSHVPDTRIVLPPQDRKAGETQQREGPQVHPTPARLVTHIGNSHSHETGTNIRRHAVQLRLGVCPAEGLQNRRQEHRKTLDGDINEEKAKGAGVVVDAKDGPLDVRPGDLLIGLCSVLANEALVCDHFLPFRQEFARPGRAGQPDGGYETDEHGHEAFEEENVAPGVDPHRGHAPGWNPGQARGQQPAKCARHRSGRYIDADAEEQFLALVKGTQVEGHAGHRSALEDTQDGARGEQARVGRHEGGAHGDEAETHHQEGEVETGADTFEDDVGGHFDEEVDDVEDGEGPVEAGAGEVEILGHALDTGVADIGAVKELKKICVKWLQLQRGFGGKSFGENSNQASCL